MLIRPMRPPAGTGEEPVPAWQAVQQSMPQHADRECRLITQSDHAKLAGDIAAQLNPRPEAAVLEAIAVHDAGWALLDQIPPPAGEVPVSFFYVPPRAVGEAWLKSIDDAEAISPLAGLMVSGHFFRLASERRNAYSGEDAAALQRFLDHESLRQARLRQEERRPPEELERFIDLLQFCDLLSLYLCCGAEMAAVFPQAVPKAGTVIRARERGFELQPRISPRPAQLTVRAYRYSPGAEGTKPEELVFRLV